ncbi:hypothetical protein M419DRAFT_120107 [Trichoderma reesei RUT C-30]|uniref:Uncharacterized protein n=1 Tax=Hypocrea jecorina (strain ATCC 56765 / BCRC 32924 / NRRL 11460 / Rut C-30) TaxID=1344414 RepID=A0A024S5N4_HYPJR|nr:hypothetical protein M419DRAFT_120107 [Trichoderma reesei RUT C-30]
MTTHPRGKRPSLTPGSRGATTCVERPRKSTCQRRRHEKGKCSAMARIVNCPKLQARCEVANRT